jgi:hypothetical protein
VNSLDKSKSIANIVNKHFFKPLLSFSNIKMTSRRGIFFNSKSRNNDKINPVPTDVSTEDASNINTDIQITTTTATTVKKKIVLNHSKRPLTKTNYSGPRKIFSTNYKVIFLIPKPFFSVFYLGESNTIKS